MYRGIVFFLTKRGLCSEILTLVYSIAYAKVNDKDLVVNDRFWNSLYTQGWSDYFKSNSSFKVEKEIPLVFSEKFMGDFFKEYRKFLFFIFVVHSVKTKRNLIFKKGFSKYLTPLFIYCKEILSENKNQIELLGNLVNDRQLKSSCYWKEILNFSSQNKIVETKQGELLLSDLFSFIARDIWRLKSNLEQNPLEGKDYISLHVRRGDKLVREADIVSVDVFIATIEYRKWDQKHIFISSDDFSVIKEFRQKRPDWKLFTLTEEASKGHEQNQFNNLSNEEIYLKTQNFLKEINIHIAASSFVGSITSNVMKLISLIRNDKTTTFSVDRVESDIYNDFFEFHV